MTYRLQSDPVFPATWAAARVLYRLVQRFDNQRVEGQVVRLLTEAISTGKCIQLEALRKHPTIITIFICHQQ